jgi:aminoglycoside phosphotransferase (APT) family kinase protein
VVAIDQPAGIPREIVDLDAVSSWLDGQGLPGGPITRVRQVGGGTQNVVLRMRWADRDVILRRPPPHPRASSNRALLREMQVLAALAGTDVPHPGFIAGCRDESVLGGVVFYLMEDVTGFNPGETLPESYAADPALRHAAAVAVAGALARLAAVDHHAVGLGEVGRPEGFLERQVPQWLSHLDSYRELPGYPGPDLPQVEEVARWLEARRPASWRPGIMHGDYHLNNVLLAPAAPEVAAIIDWEMCTVGDPLLDLGWLLVTWPGDDQLGADLAVGVELAAAGNLPGRDELIERYASDSDRDLSGIDWYVALAGFKLGIVLEGTHARACAGHADEATGDRLHRSARGLLEAAAAIASA